MTFETRGSTAARRGHINYGTHTHSAPGPKLIDSLDEHADRGGQSLITRNHDVIRRWAAERKASPATAADKNEDGSLRVLKLDFPGHGSRDLEHIDWDAWFRAFDARNLHFIYQEKLKSGQQSIFFRLDSFMAQAAA